MAKEPIATYSPATALDILRRLGRVEQRQNALLSGGLNQSFPQGPPFCMWGRTTTSQEHPTYPTSGNVVAVELGVCDPSPLTPGSDASLNFTALSPQVVVLATAYDSPLPFSGQVVPVRWMGGKWYFWHPNFRKGIAQASISAGSSGSVAIYDNGSSMGNRTCYYTWADSGAATINTNDEVWLSYRADEKKWYILPMGGGGSSSTIPECYFYGIRTYRPTDGYVSTNKIKYDRSPGSVYWTNSEGDVTGCNLEVKTSTAAAYTDYAMRVTVAGYYEFDMRLSGYDVGSGTDLGKYTATTSSSNPNLAHTHPINLGSVGTDTSATHSHYVPAITASTDPAGAHSHTSTISGYNTDSTTPSAAHDHTVDVPDGRSGLSLGSVIYYRASGGTESDWDVLAVAHDQFRNFPAPSQSWVGHYASAAPRGQRYLSANDELIFRVFAISPSSSGSVWSGAELQVVSSRAYTNCRVRYLGSSLTTTSHYP